MMVAGCCLHEDEFLGKFAMKVEIDFVDFGNAARLAVGWP